MEFIQCFNWGIQFCRHHSANPHILLAPAPAHPWQPPSSLLLGGQAACRVTAEALQAVLPLCRWVIYGSGSTLRCSCKGLCHANAMRWNKKWWTLWTQGDLGFAVGSVLKVHFKWKSGRVMNCSCFGRASWKFIFLASYMRANLLIIHWRTMDSPQVDQKVVWARAVSKVSILNETITAHPWKNHLESSPSPTNTWKASNSWTRNWRNA